MSFGSGCPIGYDKTIKSPFVAKNMGKKIFAVACIGAVKFVIGCHESEGMAFANRNFKRFQINLSECTFIDVGRYMVSVILLIVGTKMF